MAGEPELKTAMRARAISPLMLAWGVVLILLGLTLAWIYMSDDPVERASEQATPPSSDVEASAEQSVELNMPQPLSAPSTETPPAEEQTTSVATIAPAPVDQNNQTLIASQSPLTPAPNENLLVQGDNGLKPAMGPDGLIAWKEYARPFSGSEETPRIAIMVTDIGLNTRSSGAAIDDLPGQIDLAFSPYGRNLQSWLDKARAKGHEGFLMIPTEPLNYPDNDPGPHTLITELGERDNLLRLDWVLSQVTGYVGVVNHMGSKFTASEEAITPIITELQSRGLMLVDSRSTRFSMAARVARRLNMPRASNDRYLDNKLTPDEIQKQLGELEKTASTFGTALGLVRATPLAIREIALWAQTLRAKGIDLVPVSAIANRQPIR